MAKKNKTRAEREYHATIASLGCICCNAPAQVHHLREGLGMSQRNHWLVIPLCPWHHEQRHLLYDAFKMANGDEMSLLAKTLERLYAHA